MRKGSAVRAIAKGVGAAGMVGIAIAAPNAIQAIEELSKLYRKKTNRTYADYLRRTGYFEAIPHDGKFVIRLSEKGRREVKTAPFEDFEFPTENSWRGTWHILMFDIPESHRTVRQYVAKRLVELGLRPLQDSVYVYPHDLSKLAAAIRQAYPAVASLIISAEVSKIDGAKQLQRAFKCS